MRQFTRSILSAAMLAAAAICWSPPAIAGPNMDMAPDPIPMLKNDEPIAFETGGGILAVAADNGRVVQVPAGVYLNAPAAVKLQAKIGELRDLRAENAHLKVSIEAAARAHATRRFFILMLGALVAALACAGGWVLGRYGGWSPAAFE